MADLSDAPQKIVGLAGITLGACVPLRFLICIHLRMLTTAFSIIQATSTLAIGLVIGLVYMWKVGLVGLGKYLTCQIIVFY